MSLYTTESFVMLYDIVPENDVIVVPERLWSSWVNHQELEVLLVCVSHPLDTELSWVLHVHSPHRFGTNKVFLPQRILAILQDASVRIELLEEMPPTATQITLKPFQEEGYQCDLSTSVSEYLSHWQVLQEGTILSVPIEELGGFTIDCIVTKTEPGPLVLLRGEVPLELEEMVQPSLPSLHSRPPTPPPSQIPLLQPQEDDFNDIGSMVPSPQYSQQSSNTNKKGYVAFSGTGYSMR